MRSSTCCFLSVLVILVLRVPASRAQQRLQYTRTALITVPVSSDTPQAIALANTNGDNRPDILAVDADDSVVSLFLNDGNGGFSASPDNVFEVGGGPFAVSTGDFDRDGNTDLATANIDDRTVTILYGDGNGSFGDRRDVSVDTTSAACGLPDSEEPIGVAVADYNNDSYPDLAVLGDSVVYLLRGFRNDEGRGFTPLSPTCIGTRSEGAFAITTGGFDGNEFPDLAISNSASMVSVFLGNGNGTFRAARLLTVGEGPAGITVGRLDSDSRDDIAVVDSLELADLNVSLLFGNGDGTFKQEARTTAQVDSVAIANADFNNDGKTDLAVTNTFDFFVHILLNDPNGESGFQIQDIIPGLSLGQGQVAVQAGDLDGNGLPDLIALGEDTETIGVFINGTGSPTHTPEPGTATPTRPTPATPTVTGPPPTATTTPTPTQTPTPTAIPIPYGVCNTNDPGQPRLGGQLVGVASGVFRTTRRRFIAAADKMNDRIAILTAQISSGDADPCAVLGLQRGSDISNVTAPVAVLASDLDGDGHDDLAAVGSAGLSVFYGDGSGGFARASGTPMPAGTSPLSLAAADFNRDGLLDIIVGNDLSDAASLFLGRDGRRFDPACPIPIDRRAGLVIARDLNLDGLPDFAAASSQTNHVLVFLQRPPVSPTPGVASCETLMAGFRGLTPLDLTATPDAFVGYTRRVLNDSTIPQLAVGINPATASGSVVVFSGSAGAGGDVIYRQQDARVVPTPMGSDQRSHPSAAGVGDISLDLLNDLVVADRDNNAVVVFFASNAGTFGNTVVVPVRGVRPVAVAMADIDGDGRADAVTANESDGSVSILLTSKPPATPTPPPSATPTATATFTESGTPTITPTASPTRTVTATTTGTRTRAPTSTVTPTPTNTFKPGTFNLSGSGCAVDPRGGGGSLCSLCIGGIVLLIARRRLWRSPRGRCELE
jgi:hypothetical protein